MSKEYSTTSERFRCIECQHRGPASAPVIRERHPYGDGYATEILLDMDEAVCESCGGKNIYEIEDAL